ncbi:chorismate-binding protein [Candidatus Planktophila dulcis]|uniref:chorismate-binding protein n=1 Tax=Candidatus Planktophila dulcis TaxID=1884914 RepID=UPI003CEFEBDC
MFTQGSQMWMGGTYATDLVEVTDDASRLDDGSFWAISITFEGKATFARFADVAHSDFPSASWKPLDAQWISSQSQSQYISYVSAIRHIIAAGGVYQVNACRQLRHDLKDDPSLRGLFSELLKGNPAEFACYLKVDNLEIASASPERFLSRNGSGIITSPIKGTITQKEDVFGDKDKAENLMIVDLMRNDLGRICETGSVEVSELFRHEKHPGITHLVSDVSGKLREGISWSEIFTAVMAPGSVSGAPKSSALSIIGENEGVRGPYCGTLGWIHGDRAELSVAIRTFWTTGDSVLRYGTGAGITWGSDPAAEWEETQLKARHLISIAGGEL